MEDRDADTEEEEETSRPSGRRRSERTSSDWLRMKNHFLALQCVRVTMTRCLETAAPQNLASVLTPRVCLSVFLPALQRCVEEEEQLQLKTTQIRAAELSLSGLQQRRQVRISFSVLNMQLAQKKSI